jgi:protease-4
MDATYDTFLAEVAEGRGMAKDAVRQLAKGRVWSGAQALEVRAVWLASPIVSIMVNRCTP